MMHLVIEVRSQQANCGLPLDPDSSDTTGQSYHSFTIKHRLTGNNDALIAQMYEALVHLSDGEECKILTSMTEQFDPIIRLTVQGLEQMWMTGMAVQLAYEQLVRVMDKHLQAMSAVG